MQIKTVGYTFLFLDDLHLPMALFGDVLCWIYLSFLDDLHRVSIFATVTRSWIYLSFLDDLHPIQLK